METSAVGEEAVVDETSVLQFEDGLPGFPAAKRFLLREIVEDGAFQLLTSLDVEGLELVVAQPWLFFPDYMPELGSQDEQDLGLEEAEDALVFCAVTLPDGDDDPWTMNLLGPFVVNRHTLHGRQVVLEDEAANPVRAPLELPLMLVLTRRVGEAIMIGNQITIKIVDVRGDQVRIGVDAPRSVPVHREEVYREVERTNAAAAAGASRTAEALRRRAAKPSSDD